MTSTTVVKINVMLFAVHCRQRRVDQSAHRFPSSSANTYWQIEKESGTISGEMVL